MKSDKHWTINILVFEIYLTFKTVEILHTPTYLRENTLLKSLSKKIITKYINTEMKTKKIAIIFEKTINFPVFNTIIILKTEKSLQNIFFNFFFLCKHCQVQIHALIDSDIDTLFPVPNADQLVVRKFRIPMYYIWGIWSKSHQAIS